MVSTTSKTTSTASSEDLAQQIDTLKADIARLTETMTSMGKQKAYEARGDVEARAALLKERGMDAVDSAGHEIDRLTAEAERNVREKPMTALAIAAGVGVLVGFLTARK